MQIMCLVMAKVDAVVSLEDVLRQAGYEGEFRIFHKVEIAREYWEAHGRQVEFFVTEDPILVKGDGVELAKLLHRSGQPVLLLSDFDVEGAPRFNRTFAYVDGGKSLLAMIYRVYSGVSE